MRETHTGGNIRGKKYNDKNDSEHDTGKSRLNDFRGICEHTNFGSKGCGIMAEPTQRTISMFLPIEPKPQRRVRFFSRGKFSGTYKDKEQKKNEEFIGYYLERFVPAKPFECPLQLHVVCDFRMPKTKPKWWKEAAEVDIIKHTSKPDLDNCIKFITDIMQDMGFYRNDNQIIRIQAKKEYALENGWHIHLIPVSEPQSKKEFDDETLLK